MHKNCHSRQAEARIYNTIQCVLTSMSKTQSEVKQWDLETDSIRQNVGNIPCTVWGGGGQKRKGGMEKEICSVPK